MPTQKQVQASAGPASVPRTAMQEALHAGVPQSAQDQQQDVHVAKLQQAADLEDTQNGAAALTLSSGNTPPRPLSGSRRVSFKLEGKDAAAENGSSGTSAGSQHRAISLCDLREVMRRLNFTRCTSLMNKSSMAWGAIRVTTAALCLCISSLHHHCC